MNNGDVIFLFKQKTAYELRISDWSSDVCSSDLFLKLARPLTAVTLWLGLALTAAGLWWGLFASPADYLQGESVRIMYVHVPTAWLSLAGYLGLGITGIVILV